ncbi:hypothetical protein EDE11_13138, partial [Methylomonas methanica]
PLMPVVALGPIKHRQNLQETEAYYRISMVFRLLNIDINLYKSVGYGLFKID